MERSWLSLEGDRESMLSRLVDLATGIAQVGKRLEDVYLHRLARDVHAFGDLIVREVAMEKPEPWLLLII